MLTTRGRTYQSHHNLVIIDIYMNCRKLNRHRQKGVVTIPMLIGLMSLILISSIAIGSVSFNQTDMTRISNEGALALIYAEAGAKDAIQRITKDTGYPALGSRPDEYNLPVATNANCGSNLSGCVAVRVDSNDISPRIITVTGHSGSAKRKIQVDVPYDNNYKITNLFWNEVKSLPTASTGAATSVTETTMDLNAWSNPNDVSSTGYFRYSPTKPADCSDNFGIRAPLSPGSGDALSGSVPTTFSESLTGLTEGATYYYCAIVSSGNDKVYGEIFSVTMDGTFAGGSLGLPPTVTTNDTTDINDAFGSFRATLNGSANPNGFSATGWFRYWDSDPIVCKDTGGTRVPGTGGTSLGAGATSVPYSEEVTLTANTTYYVCAIAENSAGKGLGLLQSFTTTDTFSGLAAGHGTAPTITIYNRSGDTFNKLDDPSETPSSNSYAPSFSNDDLYLAVPHWFSPYLSIYKRSGTTFTKLSDDSLSELPNDKGFDAEFSQDDKYLALTIWWSFSSHYLNIYKNNRDDTFTKLPNPVSPKGISRGAAFSSDNKYLAVAHSGIPYLTIYERTGDNFAKLSNPIDINPGDTGTGVAFSSDDSYLAVSHSENEDDHSFTVYENMGNGAFEKISGIDANVGSNGDGIAFSHDDKYLAVVHTTGPFLTIYRNDGGGTFTKLTGAIDTNPGGLSRGVAFSEDDNYMAVTDASSNGSSDLRITIYEVDSINDTFTKLVSPNGPDADLAGSGQEPAFTNLPPNSTTPKTFTYKESDIALDAVTLNGGAMPMGSSTTGWFRYIQSATDPGPCDDSVWNRAPSTGGTSLGSGPSTVEYSETVNGLSQTTKYYYCAISSNTHGKTMGSVFSFITLP